MKRIIIFIALLLPVFVYAQTMHVHLNDGRIDDYSIAEIDSITFTIHPCDETVIDIDGHEYETVTICDQVWMAENLRVTHYRNGDEIPNVSDNTAWSTLTENAYCNYNNDESNADTYGCLYNGYTVIDSRNIAPEGWHVPTDEEWQTLMDCLGGIAIAANKMKEAGTDHWVSPNTGSTNESGFTGLPAGYRLGYSLFFGMGSYAHFWSSTVYESENLMSWRLIVEIENVNHGNDHFRNGFSIRCVKD